MISFVITTYKHTKRLKQNLNHNKVFFKNYEIIICNDDPHENINNLVQSEIPHAIVVNQAKNLGFSGNINSGCNRAKGKYIILLNDDVLLEDISYENSLNIFQDNVFGVSFAQKEKNGVIAGCNKLFWRNGFVQHTQMYSTEVVENGWLEGGSSIIRKDIFDKVGGFDNDFNPFYWEDIDLSYRAKKLGYKTLFNPNSVVVHHHEGTIGLLFNKPDITRVAFRNQLLFIWKNITSKELIGEHNKALFFFLLKELIKGKKEYFQGFIDAKKIFAKKNNSSKILDEELLSYC